MDKLIKSIKYFFWDKYFLKQEIIYKLSKDLIAKDKIMNKINNYGFCIAMFKGMLIGIITMSLMFTGFFIFQKDFPFPIVEILIGLWFYIRHETLKRKREMYKSMLDKPVFDNMADAINEFKKDYKSFGNHLKRFKTYIIKNTYLGD